MKTLEKRSFSPRVRGDQVSGFKSFVSRITYHVSLLFALHASLFTLTAQVKTGADLLVLKYFHLIEGKRIGLVTNHTGRLANGVFLADALHANSATKIVALFGPEHGIRGDAPDGAKMSDTIDAATGVPAYSLYGKINKPTPEMLKNIDVLMYDIQDIGARFYTYISTLSYAMEAAAEAGIPFLVLDRPNPIRGLGVEGFIREDSLRTFVGLHPIPISHGMTTGELATLFNEEGWLANGVKARLTVVRMEGWERTMWYDETDLPWIPPSPNMKYLSTAVVYPGMCLVEGTNLSEGRGTERPFEMIGAPFVRGEVLARQLNDAHLPGVVFDPIEFTPKSDPRSAPRPKHMDQVCGGVLIRVVERDSFEPVRTGIYVLSAVRRLFPDDFKWRIGGIDRLAGTKELRQSIDAGVHPDKIVEAWGDQLGAFKKLRMRYLLY